MVQNNKVLTVSYGTFSCTLEGFEDSFGTMKAIAEYFRDLAADDRYFGAEPPQPDADMLARIAQREIARQVEARTSNDGIHLRAALPAETGPVAPQPAAAPAPAEPAPQPSAAEANTVVTPADQTPSEMEPGVVDFFGDPADAVAQSDTTVAPTEAAAEEAFSIDGSTEEPFADDFIDEDEEDVAIAAPVSDDLKETPPGEVDFFVAPEVAKQQAEEAVEEAPVAEEPFSLDDSVEEPFAEDIAAEAPIVEETAEFEVEEDAEETTEEPLVDLEQIAAVVAADETVEPAPEEIEEIVAEPVAEPAPAKPAANSIAAKLQRIRAVVSRTPVDEFSEDQHADAVSDKAKEAAEDINQTLNAETQADDFADIAEHEGEEDDNDTLISRALEELQRDRSSEQDETVAAEPAATTKVEPEAEVEEAAKPRRARVIRVRRGVTKPTETIAEPAGPPSTLSDADEDDLRRELAAVEAELRAATQADTQAAPPQSNDTVAADTSEQPPMAQDTSDSDVSRLMAAADEKLDDPDTASSRETYGHMRAAVAAAQNDPVSSSDEAEKDYRQDLATVVQPRRPVVRRKAPRPTSNDSRPAPVTAPLKLVAEQRVSEPEAAPSAPAAPVRPRRVKTESKPSSAEAFNADTGFAKFVQETGAVELPELLEAAASYLSFVKGQDVFSRPELINKVRATGTEFNREDSMRSFGQLLREGKIARRRNGRFSASDQIGFQPQGRAAG
ncbi:chemotaxis protein CheA [Epibacterium sp. SM1979]|uniref:Chemotaxis protein CheA n=1 Tax=Tritonibacter litoralis TaxID=2662264 RepID=A0A843YAB9_9RHOB|nr:chemotaxis protein CheA [Tritonibacter litoralis]MQQ07876.1 chemotaxis protein CheA [Tritonibacter litoralis]